jgi:predicted phosphodiesterase
MPSSRHHSPRHPTGRQFQYPFPVVVDRRGDSGQCHYNIPGLDIFTPRRGAPMKRLSLILAAGCLLLGAIAFSDIAKPIAGELQVTVDERNPWTNLRLNNAPTDFRFAIVSDRTGGHRARIFSQAVEQLNLLQPEFVVSVGDLIEGYTEDSAELTGEWKEFQGYVSRLQMPFFYVAGNHDVSNPAQHKLWRNKFGRSYYHFTYKNVLFLLLNSDDPHKLGLSAEQIDYVKKALADNASVHWTFVMLHRPLWVEPDPKANGWLAVEEALGDRPATVFAGHVHRYQKFVRHGRNLYQLATTGGSSKIRGIHYGEFDHVVWVTMKKTGPVFANLMLDGIYTEEMRRPVTEETGVPDKNRKPPQIVQGRFHRAGTPVPGAQLAFFNEVSANGVKRWVRVGDALVEPDGAYQASTYNAFDGLPAGDYRVVATLYQIDPQGRPGSNLLPQQYAKPETTPLGIKVQGGANVVDFNLEN